MFKPAFVLSLLLASGAIVAQEPSFDALRGEGHWKQLRPRIESWYSMKPQDPYALMWMSRLKVAFGEPEVALDLARKAVALKHTDSEIQTQLGKAAAAAQNRLPFLKQYSLAKERQTALETAVTLNPGNEEATKSLFSYYLAAPAIAGGSKSKAKELAQRSANIKPATGLVFQAKIAIVAKDYEAAGGYLQRAITADPHCLDAYSLLVTGYLSRKPQALDAAAAVCRKAIEANPAAIESYAMLGRILAVQGKWGELDAIFAQARLNCPDNLLPYFDAADTLLGNDRLDKVESYLRIYLTQDPEGMAPDHAQAYALLGQFYEKRGRRPEAIKAYEQALSLRPTFESARKELERLRKG